MRAQIKAGRLIVIPASDADADELARWKSEHAGFAFVLNDKPARGASLAPLGPRADACREPINVYGGNPDPQIRLIANLAPTPFDLDGQRYACVEAFWQSLRFPPEERSRIAAMDGPTAKRASHAQPYGSHVVYGGAAIPVGTHAHWQLMRRACVAKFDQNDNARVALLATGDRPLVHRVRPDSLTIPGVVMADIWIALRTRFRRRSR